MRLLWQEHAWADYEWWQQQDRRMLRRINQLLRDIRRDPYQGIGKPEQLRGDLTGWWSRRIDDEHRLVYRHRDDTVEIAACRYHYGT
ncbi:MAG: Txe/YoeB family addiction module toxin [Micrococcales bacterium]|nr:Txe/YoeB family addiction module toxin [Micrococcales bacterium]